MHPSMSLRVTVQVSWECVCVCVWACRANCYSAFGNGIDQPKGVQVTFGMQSYVALRGKQTHTRTDGRFGDRNTSVRKQQQTVTKRYKVEENTKAGRVKIEDIHQMKKVM